MKHTCITILFFAIILNLHSQPILFHKVYPGIAGEFMVIEFNIVQTNDNGYLIGNHSTLMKLDSMGFKSWRMEMNVNANLTIGNLAISPDFDNGHLITGWRTITSLSNAFNIDWIRQIISNENLLFYSMKKTNSFSYVLGGTASLPSGATPCMTKIDTAGNVLWSKLYFSNNDFAEISSLVTLQDGSILAVGTSTSIYDPNLFDCVIFKTDSNGNVQWSKTYGALNSTLNGKSIDIIDDNQFIVSGRRNLHRFLTKIDSSGNIIWSKFYESGLSGHSRHALVTNEGGYAMVGEMTDNVPGGSGQTSVFIKTDSLGNLEWGRTLGGYGSVSASHVLQTTDGGYAIAGRRSAIGGNKSLNLIKTDSLGHTAGCLEGPLNATVTSFNDTIKNFMLTDSSIAVTTVPIILTFPLVGSQIDLCNFQGLNDYDYTFNHLEIYPNPNSGNFQIRFESLNLLPVELEILNINNQILYHLNLTESVTNIELPNRISSGLYYCRIKLKNAVITKKLIIQN